MFLIFFALWIIFNGKFTVEIVLFGIGIAAAVDFFIIKFMDYNPRNTWRAIKLLPQIIRYLWVLVREIFIANVQTTKMIYSAKVEVEPVLVTFKTKLKTENARVALANSITLTPGTITVSLEGNEFVVHCLDRDYAEGIENTIFEKLLLKMEETV